MVLSDDSVAYRVGNSLGHAVFFLILVAVLGWILYRSRHRRR
jgi:cbb3-type cytochrome oxidase subunit 3